jgi:hypothetical protein
VYRRLRGADGFCWWTTCRLADNARSYAVITEYVSNVLTSTWWYSSHRRRKLWGSHSGHYEECRLLGYKVPVCTSQETYYVSATESSRLMLSKIWGFHGGDCEECRLLGNKNPVRTSQETHYVSTTEPSRLMLCKIWGFHGGDYEECRLVRCDAVSNK